MDGAEDELGDFDVVDGGEQPMADMIVDSNQNSIAFLTSADIGPPVESKIKLMNTAQKSKIG